MSFRLPVVTVLICTYNRCQDLLELLDSIDSQDTCGLFTIEALVVDNNSSDGTRAAMQKRPAVAGVEVRYVFEGKQGKDAALNTGIAFATGEIVSVIDSDQLLPPAYLWTVFQTFRCWPDVDMIGGRVLPQWSAPPPQWLTSQHWSAIAMADYGRAPFCLDPANPICLLATSFRTRSIRRSGGYRVGLSVSKDKVGGVEDAEIIERMLRMGFKGLYQPALRLEHKVEANRLTREYHRRWHTSHGYFFAELRDPAFERSRHRLLDVPIHIFAQACRTAWAWGRALMARSESAFREELHLRFLFGFVVQRLRSGYARSDVNLVGE